MTSTHCRRRTTSQFLKVASLVALLLELTQLTGSNQRPRLEICCVMLTSTDGMMADRHIPFRQIQSTLQYENRLILLTVKASDVSSDKSFAGHRGTNGRSIA